MPAPNEDEEAAALFNAKPLYEGPEFPLASKKLIFKLMAMDS